MMMMLMLDDVADVVVNVACLLACLLAYLLTGGQAEISLCSSESVSWSKFQNSMKSLLGRLEQSSAELSWANRGLKFALFEPIQSFQVH